MYAEVPADKKEHGAMSFSSGEINPWAKEHLAWARMTHFDKDANTHAEDRLYAYVHQLAIIRSIKKKGKEKKSKSPDKKGKSKLLDKIFIPVFFISHSPCSSHFGTSTKIGANGCTENLIEWATKGMPIESEDGEEFLVKVKIGKLIVNKLYNCGSYKNAEKSMKALKRLLQTGAIGEWKIETDPSLKDHKRFGYQSKSKKKGGNPF